MRVLAATSRLAYVPGFGLRLLANRLHVNNPGLSNLELDLVFVQDAVADDFQMQLAHSADDGLPDCGFCLNSDGRICLGKLAQCSLKLRAVIIAPRTDGHRYYETVLRARFAHVSFQPGSFEIENHNVRTDSTTCA